MGPLKYLQRGMYLLPLALLCACGLSDPQIPRAFYYDPPNKQIEGDPSATWIRYQSVARLTPGGYDTTDLESYDGEWFYYRNSAWNPADQVMYAYKVNYKPGQTWLMAVSVPKMELKPVSRIPDLPRGGGFSPLFAFDTTRGTLIVADAQRPCGSAFVNTWYSYDVHGDTWTKNTLDKYAFTTLNYDPVQDNFVGVGMKSGEGRVVVRMDHAGQMVSQVEADLCDVLEPRIHGYEGMHYQSQIVDGIVHIYRHVYYGRHAVDGRYWERQHYTVDIATGAVSRQR